MNNVLGNIENVSVTALVTKENISERPPVSEEVSDVPSSQMNEKGLLESQIISTINESGQVLASVSTILPNYELERGPVMDFADNQLPTVQSDNEMEQQVGLTAHNEVEDEHRVVYMSETSAIRNQFENPELWLLSQRKDWKLPSCLSILKFIWISLFAVGIVTCWVYLCLSWYDMLAKKLGSCQGQTNETGLLILLMFSTSSATCGLFYIFCLILYIKNSHSVDSVAWGTSCLLVAIGSEMISLIVIAIFVFQDRAPHCYESVVYFVPPLIIQALILFYLGLPYLVNQRRMQRYKILALKRKMAPLIS